MYQISDFIYRIIYSFQKSKDKRIQKIQFFFTEIKYANNEIPTWNSILKAFYS